MKNWGGENVYRLFHRIFQFSRRQTYFHFLNFFHSARKPKKPIVWKAVWCCCRRECLMERKSFTVWHTNMHRNGTACTFFDSVQILQQTPTTERNCIKYYTHHNSGVIRWKMCSLTFHSARHSLARENQSNRKILRECYRGNFRYTRKFLCVKKWEKL